MRSTTPRDVPAGRALHVVAIAFLIAVVVNGQSLHRLAEAQPYGPAREVAVVLTAPVDVVAGRLGLGTPRRLVEEATGRPPPPTDHRFGSRVQLERADPPAPPTLPRWSTRWGAAADVQPSPPAPVATVPGPVRVATAEDPVRVLFAGDSLVANVATGFGRAFRSEPRLTVDVEFHVATGLARPDVLDWPSRLAALLDGSAPDVVVLLFGANDDQDLRTGDGRAVLLGDEWRVEYARRIGVMMDLAATDGRHVVWLALPAMQRDGLEQARQVMNDLAGREATERERVSIVDLDRILTPEGYDAEVDGTRARERDGVHMTIAGGALAAAEILAAFAESYGIE